MTEQERLTAFQNEINALSAKYGYTLTPTITLNPQLLDAVQVFIKMLTGTGQVSISIGINPVQGWVDPAGTQPRPSEQSATSESPRHGFRERRHRRR